MTDQPTGDPTDRLTYQQIDALWDAVAIPGPTEPTFPMQHERVCRAVAEILAELTPARPAVPVSSPPPDQTAEPVCKFEEGCHRVVPCYPGCAVAAAELYHRLTAVLPPPADRAAVLREAAEVAVREARGCGDSETGQYAASVAAGIGKVLRRMAVEAEQQTETRPVEPTVGYSGKGRVWCLRCPHPEDENVPVSVDLLQPHEECAGYRRTVVGVAQTLGPN